MRKRKQENKEIKNMLQRVKNMLQRVKNIKQEIKNRVQLQGTGNRQKFVLFVLFIPILRNMEIKNMTQTIRNKVNENKQILITKH
jgi:hypothetical protein